MWLKFETNIKTVISNQPNFIYMVTQTELSVSDVWPVGIGIQECQKCHRAGG